MSEFPTLAEVLAPHADYVSNGVRYCTCGTWGDDSETAQHSRLAFMTHVREVWMDACTITTAEQLDALPLNTVVVDASGIPRTKRHGNSYMPAGWTHAGNLPLKSRELADGRPMYVVSHPEWGKP